MGDRMEKLVMTDGLAKSINDQIRDDVFVEGAIAMRKIGPIMVPEASIPDSLLKALRQAEGANDGPSRKRAADDLLIWAATSQRLAPRRMIGR
jgi:hypothetical protein